MRENGGIWGMLDAHAPARIHWLKVFRLVRAKGPRQIWNFLSGIEY
jgi:hypothetical protein